MIRLLRIHVSLFTILAFLLNGVSVAYMVSADPSDELPASAEVSTTSATTLLDDNDIHSFDLSHGCNHGCHAASHLLAIVNNLPLLHISKNISYPFTSLSQPILQSWDEGIFHPPRL